MLAQQHRITKKKEFDHIFNKGRTFFTPLFVFRVVPTERNVARFAFVVSNKVSKQATKRNLIKRRMRAAVERAIDHVRPGTDTLIIASQKVVTNGDALPYPDLERSILYGLRKTQVLNNSSH